MGRCPSSAEGSPAGCPGPELLLGGLAQPRAADLKAPLQPAPFKGPLGPHAPQQKQTNRQGRAGLVPGGRCRVRRVPGARFAWCPVPGSPGARFVWCPVPGSSSARIPTARQRGSTAAQQAGRQQASTRTQQHARTAARAHSSTRTQQHTGGRVSFQEGGGGGGDGEGEGYFNKKTKVLLKRIRFWIPPAFGSLPLPFLEGGGGGERLFLRKACFS